MRRTNLSIILILMALFAFSVAVNASDNAQSSKPNAFGTPEPKTALEHSNRGVELGSRGLWAEAVKEHSLSLLEDPANKVFRTNLSSAHLHFGQLLLKKGDLLGATAQFHRALYIDPANLDAAEKLKTLAQDGSGKVAKKQVPTQEELDQFLKGKLDALPGFDAY